MDPFVVKYKIEKHMLAEADTEGDPENSEFEDIYGQPEDYNILN